MDKTTGPARAQWFYFCYGYKVVQNAKRLQGSIEYSWLLVKGNDVTGNMLLVA